MSSAVDLGIIAVAWLADRLAAKIAADRSDARARQAAELAAARKHDLACRRALAAAVNARPEGGQP